MVRHYRPLDLGIQFMEIIFCWHVHYVREFWGHVIILERLVIGIASIRRVSHLVKVSVCFLLD